MHSLETKYKAIIHYKHFLRNLRTVARIHGVSKSSLQRWVRSETNSGMPLPKKQRAPRRGCVTEAVAACVRKHIAENPFLTAAQVASVIAEECGVRMSRRTASRSLKLLQLTKKKAYRCTNHEHDPSAVQEFCNEYLQQSQVSLLCVDEAGFYVGDCPKRGYSPRGARLRVAMSRTLRRKKYTLIMAISCNGIEHFEILEQNCRKQDFVAFIENIPSAACAGATLLMDNIQFHHSKETKKALEARGLRALYTPPYCPKFNAIEYLFSSVKQAYRSNCPPCVQDNFDYPGAFLGAISQAAASLDIRRYFVHVGKLVEEARAAIAKTGRCPEFLGYN